MANRYSHKFVAICPNNGAPIIYQLVIETDNRMIQVEHIVTAVALFKQGYHEQFADELYRRFGGRQTLSGHHHGVDIETIRGDLSDKPEKVEVGHEDRLRQAEEDAVRTANLYSGIGG